MGNSSSSVKDHRKAELTARAALVFAWEQLRKEEEEQQQGTGGVNTAKKEKKKSSKKHDVVVGGGGDALCLGELPLDMIRLVALARPIAALTTFEGLGKQPKTVLMFHGVRKSMRKSLRYHKRRVEGTAADSASNDTIADDLAGLRLATGIHSARNDDDEDEDGDLSNEDFESELHQKRKEASGIGGSLVQKLVALMADSGRDLPLYPSCMAASPNGTVLISFPNEDCVVEFELPSTDHLEPAASARDACKRVEPARVKRIYFGCGKVISMAFVPGIHRDKVREMLQSPDSKLGPDVEDIHFMVVVTEASAGNVQLVGLPVINPPKGAPAPVIRIIPLRPGVTVRNAAAVACDSCESWAYPLAELEHADQSLTAAISQAKSLCLVSCGDRGVKVLTVPGLAELPTRHHGPAYSLATFPSSETGQAITNVRSAQGWPRLFQFSPLSDDKPVTHRVPRSSQQDLDTTVDPPSACLAFDREGVVYLADRPDKVVKVFKNTRGDLACKKKLGLDIFAGPRCLCIDTRDRLLVLDSDQSVYLHIY